MNFGWIVLIGAGVFFALAALLFIMAVAKRMRDPSISGYTESVGMINCSAMLTCSVMILLVAGAVLVLATGTCQ